MLHDLIRTIARELGPSWTASIQSTDTFSLHTPDLDFLRIRHDPRGDRLTVDGAAVGGLGPHWPRTGRGPLHHRITISAGKTPARIAGEINRRLLPDYRAARAIAATSLEAARREHTEATRAITSVTRLLGGTVEDRTIRVDGPPSHLTGTITIADGDIALRLRLPAHHATSLAQALRRFRAAH
ncbi:hypothetical protein FF36_06401 [Frankia torreyi]|uniref:Uncharacterized protein n=1 Tax=Frankia torreyi TaxID=1856 RepID=A0A0D8B5F4_9ACTN|nr:MULTISPECIES: hypothetical protein [Frankia]KJE19325.1 hypothetical protein FF36_06401 [Frankia torreyi]KQM03597.1 hypothetical protein FF86_10374 [Frankia sp. CpI1-P]